jgi:hypothetical protein
MWRGAVDSERGMGEQRDQSVEGGPSFMEDIEIGVGALDRYGGSNHSENPFCSRYSGGLWAG